LCSEAKRKEIVVQLTKENPRQRFVWQTNFKFISGRLEVFRLIGLLAFTGGYQAMNNQPIQSQLEKLHAELQGAESPDKNERELLERLALDIRNILEKGSDSTQQYIGLGERLKDAIAELEASHPRATLSMRQVIDQLAFLGI